VVGTSPSGAEGMSSIPGWGAEIPQASLLKNQNWFFSHTQLEKAGLTEYFFQNSDPEKLEIFLGEILKLAK